MTWGVLLAWLTSVAFGVVSAIVPVVNAELYVLASQVTLEVGVVPIARAQEIAQRANLDLVEVAPDARPPVVRIMDYGKWRYEQEQKAKQARKHQSQIVIKEIKFRPKIDPHDYATKKGHVERELLHPERGEAILLRLADELKDLALIESRPNLDGRNMIMMLAPVKEIAAPAKESGAASAAPVPQTSDES